MPKFSMISGFLWDQPGNTGPHVLSPPPHAPTSCSTLVLLQLKALSMSPRMFVYNSYTVHVEVVVMECPMHVSLLLLN